MTRPSVGRLLRREPVQMTAVSFGRPSHPLGPDEGSTHPELLRLTVRFRWSQVFGVLGYQGGSDPGRRTGHHPESSLDESDLRGNDLARLHFARGLGEEPVEAHMTTLDGRHREGTGAKEPDCPEPLVESHGQVAGWGSAFWQFAQTPKNSSRWVIPAKP